MLTALLLVLAYGPATVLHGFNGKWAMGSPLARVWALMIVDAVLVGLLAGSTATALFLGHSAFVGSDKERSTG